MLLNWAIFILALITYSALSFYLNRTTGKQQKDLAQINKHLEQRMREKPSFKNQLAYLDHTNPAYRQGLSHFASYTFKLVSNVFLIAYLLFLTLTATPWFTNLQAGSTLLFVCYLFPAMLIYIISSNPTKTLQTLLTTLTLYVIMTYCLPLTIDTWTTPWYLIVPLGIYVDYQTTKILTFLNLKQDQIYI